MKCSRRFGERRKVKANLPVGLRTSRASKGERLTKTFWEWTAMALLNFTLPFGAVNPPATSWATISPIHASPHAVNNLYEPAGHHQENVLHNDDYYKNGPYRHHQPQQQQQQQNNNNRNYLPPHQPPNNGNSNNRNGYAQAGRTRTYGENSYSQQSPTSFSNLQTNNKNSGFYNNGQSFKENPYQAQQQKQPLPQTTKAPNSRTTASFQSNSNTNSKNFNLNQAAGYPERPPGFKPIQAGQGSRTQNGEFGKALTS